VRIVSTPRRPGERLLRACALFGLAVERAGSGDHARRAARTAASLDRAARTGGLTLLVGPSGAGKSSAMRALAARLRGRGEPIIAWPRVPASRERGPLVELLPGPLAGRLRTLGEAGLAEAALLARPVNQLSEGERSRACLALAMHRASRPGARRTLLIDEFTSGLDSATAGSVAISLARWCARSPRVRVIAATSREELAGWIKNATVVRLGVCAPPPAPGPAPSEGGTT